MQKKITIACLPCTNFECDHGHRFSELTIHEVNLGDLLDALGDEGIVALRQELAERDAAVEVQS